MREKIIQAAKERAVNSELACVHAHEIAADLGIDPMEVGKAVNRATNLRFCRCQIGLFGYGPKPEGRHKVVLKAEHVPEEIEAALIAKSIDGHITCKAIWDVADQFTYPRLAVANIVEAMELKVTPCQLGCF